MRKCSLFIGINILICTVCVKVGRLLCIPNHSVQNCIPLYIILLFVIVLEVLMYLVSRYISLKHSLETVIFINIPILCINRGTNTLTLNTISTLNLTLIITLKFKIGGG